MSKALFFDEEYKKVDADIISKDEVFESNIILKVHLLTKKWNKII